MCVAFAPWDDVWTCDYVPVADFFKVGGAWPETWRTKRRLWPLDRVKDGKPPRIATSYEVGGFAVGYLSDGRAALVQIASLGEYDCLVEVRTMLDGPEIPVSAWPEVKRWWPINPRYKAGAAKLWKKGEPVTAANYRFLCILCANAEKPAMERYRERKAAEKAAKPSE